MKIFDCHFHIDSGDERYDIDVAGRNVIFNSFASYHQHITSVKGTDSVSIIFDHVHHFADVKQMLNEKKVAALKIHARVQKLAAADYPALIEKLRELVPTVPVIIDAFYFGDDLEYQPSLQQIINIARAFPSLPIIVAHCGGIEILKYFYHLRPLENIHYDLSFSLAYLRQASVFADYKNLVKYSSHDRIMFGTDFPYVGAKLQLDAFNEIVNSMNIPETSVEKMLFGNAVRLFGK